MEMVHPRSASYCKPRFWTLDLRGWKSIQENLLIPALVGSGMETFLWHAESTDWLAGFQSSLSEPQFPKAQQSFCDYLLCSKRITRGPGQYATATRYFWFCWPLCRNSGNRKASCFARGLPQARKSIPSKTVGAQKRFTVSIYLVSASYLIHQHFHINECDWKPSFCAHFAFWAKCRRAMS